jgi:hypothetical protein
VEVKVIDIRLASLHRYWVTADAIKDSDHGRVLWSGLCGHRGISKIKMQTAAALTGGLTADAFARGGGGHMGGGGGHMGGFGGVHMGGGFGGARMGGGLGGPHLGGGHMGGGFGPHFAGTRGRFGAGDMGLYDSCDYTSLYYNPDSCYLNGSPLGTLNQ